jgi:3-dehydrosphinganine reductase
MFSVAAGYFDAVTDAFTTFPYGSLIILPLLLIVFLILAYLSSFFNNFNPSGKHVMITGGSAGIGLEVAREYIRLGANITIIARNKAKLIDTVKGLEIFDHALTQNGKKASPSKIKAVALDVSSSQDEVSRAVESLVQDMGSSVDVLVNCAGTSFAGAFDESPTEQFQSMFRTNVMGTVFPTRAVVSGMKSKNSGRVVFVSSQVAQAAVHGYTVPSHHFHNFYFIKIPQ